MNGDRLSFTTRQLCTDSPKVKMPFFHTHHTKPEHAGAAEQNPTCPLPSQTYASYGRGVVPFHHSCFSRNTSLLCADIVTAKLRGYLSSSLMLPPHVSYTSLLLVILELACYLVLLYQGVQNPFDFKGFILR